MYYTWYMTNLFLIHLILIITVRLSDLLPDQVWDVDDGVGLVFDLPPDQVVLVHVQLAENDYTLIVY